MPASAAVGLPGGAALGHVGFLVRGSREAGVQEAEVDMRTPGLPSGPEWSASER